MAEAATQQVLAPVDLAHALAATIHAKRQQRLEQRAHEPPWKPRRHYASNLHGCARQLVYAITHYQEREPFTPEAVAHMEDGQHEEKLLIAELVADGFDIVEQQVQLDDDRYWITGKIDGKIRWQGLRIPFEVKRVSEYALAKIETVTDIKADPYLIDKLRQLTLYLYLHSIEVGLFYFSDGRGARREIVVPLDYALAESILRDLDTANAALKADILPDRIPYHSKVCGRCNFRKTCLPDMDFGQGAALGNDELQTAVARLQEIKPQVAEADRLKREIKQTVEGKPLVIAGDYLITGEWKERAVKATEARVDRYWSWEVEEKTNA